MYALPVTSIRRVNCPLFLFEYDAPTACRYFASTRCKSNREEGWILKFVNRCVERILYLSYKCHFALMLYFVGDTNVNRWEKFCIISRFFSLQFVRILKTKFFLTCFLPFFLFHIIFNLFHIMFNNESFLLVEKSSRWILIHSAPWSEIRIPLS